MTDSKKAIALLSGGLDSTVAFKKSSLEGEVVLAITFDYGQRAALKEIKAAARIAGSSGVSHEIIELPWLKEITKPALVDSVMALPQLKEHELDGEGGKTDDSAKSVWVPNRNGLFINVAAAYCEALGADQIITGFNSEEAATFPDNSIEFLEAINVSLSYSTLNKTKVISPTSKLNKAEIVRLGMEIGAPLNLLWSCYEGGENMCGVCESCLRLKRGLYEAGCDLVTSLF